MRKKLLSLLTVLCMVLGMLPVTAMAAEIEDIAAELGYSEEEIAAARYIDEDTDLDEDEDGLIIIVAPVKVTVKGAKLTTGVLVAPGAEGAVLTVAEAAEVNAIIVMATAEVVVEEDTTVNYITVTAPETTIAIAGEAQTVEVTEAAENTTVTVTGTAEKAIVSAPGAAVEVADEGEVASVSVEETAVGATVTVGEDATAATVEIAAPDVTVEVSGTVETVAVAETATGAELVVNENAAISEVTDATGELTVSGDGAENVTVTDTSEAEEEEDAEDEEEEEENTEDEEPVIDFAPTVVPETTVTTVDLGLKPANLEDHPVNGEPINKDEICGTYTVTTTKSSADPDNEYRVVITATDLQKHYSANQLVYGWVGIAIPHDNNYTYYQLKCDTGAISEKTPGTWETENGTFDVFYYAFTTGDRHDGTGYTYQLAVFESTPEGEVTASDFESAKYVLDLAFEITMAESQTYGEGTPASQDDAIPVGSDNKDETTDGEEETPKEDDSNANTPSDGDSTNKDDSSNGVTDETPGAEKTEVPEQISVDENLTETPDAE